MTDYRITEITNIFKYFDSSVLTSGCSALMCLLNCNIFLIIKSNCSHLGYFCTSDLSLWDQAKIGTFLYCLTWYVGNWKTFDLICIGFQTAVLLFFLTQYLHCKWLRYGKWVRVHLDHHTLCSVVIPLIV